MIPSEWPDEVKDAIEKAMSPLVTGEFMVAWAKENVSKYCSLCHGARYIVGMRGGKPLKEVCGCAAKRFQRAFADKVEPKGNQLAWRKGFVPTEGIAG